MDSLADPLGLFLKFTVLYIVVCAFMLWVASKILP